MELTIQEIQELQLEILATLVDVCEKNNISYFIHGGNAIGAIRHGGPIPWDHDMDILVPESQIDLFCECLQAKLDSKFYIDYHRLDARSKRIFPKITLAAYESGIFHVDIFRLIGFPSNLKEQLKIYKKIDVLRKILEIKRRYVKTKIYKKILFFIPCAVALIIPTRLLLKAYDKACARYPYGEAEYVGYLGGKHGIRNMFRRELFDAYTMVDYAGIPVRIVKEYDFYLTQLYGDYMQLPPEEEQRKAMHKIYTVKAKKR